MEKYVCIHGHFYQPPRENPWLEAIELQDSAHPYHDWNERITAECYAPNATARRLDGDGRIVDIVNNYSRISFNFGPTLVAWMEEKAPDVMAAIVEADRQSCERFAGHGSALAQAYNHIIHPLANRRDKVTQVVWGIRDFERRFGRKPEGMWLAECAADEESLDVLAEHGIKFTVLSPYQGSQMRRLGDEHWEDVDGGRIDPSRAYQVNLPSGRSIAVFFYDAHVSKAVAFERLLNSGETFAHRLMSGFDDGRQWDQLMHIATDGESYGHHHHYGEMGLAAALNYIESNNLARLTTYGEFLANHPPTHEAKIHEGSAWSCAHGVGRWHRDCGCNSGGRPGWNQRWRQPLRDSLDWLRDELIPLYESKGSEFFKDPWKARDAYIAVIHDRSEENVSQFLKEQCTRELNEEDRLVALRLLEMQRHAMLMYTSCGWFFDELSGIETVQIIQYAGRVIQLARSVFNKDLEPEFLERLSKARSNLPQWGDGRRIYEKCVRPSVMDREWLAAHYAVSSLFENYPSTTRIYRFLFEQQHRHEVQAERVRLVIGVAKVVFEITGATDMLSYAALHRGEHDVNCGVRYFRGETEFQQLVSEFTTVFDKGDFAAITKLMEHHFGESNYSLKDLFRDEQRKILAQILSSTGQDLEGRFRQMMEQYAPLMKYLRDIEASVPAPLMMASDFVLNADLRRQFESGQPDPEKVRQLFETAQKENVELDIEELAYAIKMHFDERLDRLTKQPDDVAFLTHTAEVAAVVQEMNLEINLWKTQNLYFRLLNDVFPKHRDQVGAGESVAADWVAQFTKLGERLGFKVNGDA